MKAVFAQLLEQIPEYQAFLTAEELDESSRALARDYPELVELFEMGVTKTGKPILCLKIGNGSRNALMFGCPHPNEPIGTMMLEYLTRALCEREDLRRELDYTWYVVKAWDRDGLELNEGWLKGPYTLYNYSRNFFRPAGHKQVDWTFPIDYKELHFHEPIPETTAMMALIEKIRPAFIYSLHNAGFGGVYWYISRELPGLYDDMRAAARKVEVPLNLGEPEAPYCVQLSPAVYKSLGIQQEYDYLEKYGAKNIGEIIKVGTCSEQFARELCGTFTLLTELPYFFDQRINDLSPSDVTRADAAMEALEWNKTSNAYVLETLEPARPYLSSDNPFLLALDAFTASRGEEANRNMIRTNPDFARTATVAEKFDNLLMRKFYKLLSYGMLIRAGEQELEAMKAKGETCPEKRQVLEASCAKATLEHQKLAAWLEQEIDYQVVPIRKLVYIQLACGLMVAEAVHQGA